MAEDSEEVWILKESGKTKVDNTRQRVPYAPTYFRSSFEPVFLPNPEQWIELYSNRNIHGTMMKHSCMAIHPSELWALLDHLTLRLERG